MDNDLFWDVFRDTGDPLCWLLTRGKPEPESDSELPDRTEEKPSVPV